MTCSIDRSPRWTEAGGLLKNNFALFRSLLMEAIVKTSALLLALALATALASQASAGQARSVSPSQVLRVGAELPDATMTASDGRVVRLAGDPGRVRILSVVPQLNTPVCDEQTHRFSEDNRGLDRSVEILTLSTNTPDDQARFAAKAGIANITFYSDQPSFEFGKRTGLYIPMLKVLHRAVIVVDAGNVIRYVEIVPMGQLPNFEAAYEAARRLVEQR